MEIICFWVCLGFFELWHWSMQTLLLLFQWLLWIEELQINLPYYPQLLHPRNMWRWLLPPGPQNLLQAVKSLSSNFLPHKQEICSGGCQQCSQVSTLSSCWSVHWAGKWSIEANSLLPSLPVSFLFLKDSTISSCASLFTVIAVLSLLVSVFNFYAFVK